MNVYETAKALLTAVEEVFQDAFVELPERRYVHLGNVAIDNCEALIIQVEAAGNGSVVRRGEAFDNVQPGHVWRNVVDFSIWILRCVPVMDDSGNPPSVDAEDESSLELMTDMWTLWNGMRVKHAAKELFDNCTAIEFGDFLPYGPEGAFGGGRLQVTIAL